MSERDLSRMGVDSKPPLPIHGQQQLPNSKSVPAALHHVGNGAPSISNAAAANVNAASNKSRSINNLAGGDQSFYQNLSVYRNQNQSQPNLGER